MKHKQTALCSICFNPWKPFKCKSESSITSQACQERGHEGKNNAASETVWRCSWEAQHPHSCPSPSKTGWIGEAQNANSSSSLPTTLYPCVYLHSFVYLLILSPQAIKLCIHNYISSVLLDSLRPFT